ncbi:MAG: hypothetical protein MI739_02125, partial [Bacteroidales bacterium]|nr:hypothetical protein [Bacteroidales bacterium]
MGERIVFSLFVLVFIYSCNAQNQEDVREYTDNQWMYFEEGGKLVAKGEYKDSVLHGRYFKYSNTGGIVEYGVMNNNRKDGLWRYISTTGELDSVLSYNLDTLFYVHDK